MSERMQGRSFFFNAGVADYHLDSFCLFLPLFASVGHPTPGRSHPTRGLAAGAGPYSVKAFALFFQVRGLLYV